MAKRYSKYYSNYILKKKYQYTTKGTIWERDWVTIGAQHQIEKGKRPFYGDSGFLFTDNSIPDRHKRHDFGKIVGEWTYDDVYPPTSEINLPKLNYISNDLRDFAYYGSCVELIRTSILNIITWFPACMRITDREVEANWYVFDNPFGIDLLTEDIAKIEVKNEHRFLAKTWKSYELVTRNSQTGVTEHERIVDYRIDNRNDIDKCEGLQLIATISVCTEKKPLGFPVRVYWNEGNFIYAARYTDNDLITEIRPLESIIEEYFYNLDGFEELLLRRDTKPLYTNSFLKMFDTIHGIRYAYRTYTWPCINDYCIDIESPIYLSFVEDLSQTARDLDDMWCDNMWRNMTHEAIKNYDWTYTKDYMSDDELEFIEGGNRIEKLIRVYGRVFDDIKRYVEGIRFTINTTYDGFNNITNSEMSDKLEYGGWDIYSTIPSFDADDDLSTVFLSDNFIDLNSLKWFMSTNNNEVTAVDNDIFFMRRLSLSSKYLLKAKGTLKGIDMVLALFGIGPNEYSIEEHYRIAEINPFIGNTVKKVADLVHYDSPSWFYDDPYEGVPFGNVELYGKSFIVPFYDHSKRYLGELAFQSKGGWYKKSLDLSEQNDYEETLSYLNVVPNFNALLEVNTYALDENHDVENIYYVVDVSDYLEYDTLPQYGLTHYFWCNNIYNPEQPKSWTPIVKYVLDMENTITKEEYDNLPAYIKVSDLDATVASGVSLPNLPDEIQTTNISEYENLGYVFICNDVVVRYITVSEYNIGNFGYNTKLDPCNVKNGLYIDAYKCKHTLSNQPIQSEIPFMADINNMSGLNEIGHSIYNVLGYAKDGSIQEEPDFETSLYDVLQNGWWSQYLSPGYTYDLRQIYEKFDKLTQSDYFSLKSLYDDPSDNYVKIDENTYAPIISGDTELWERAEYLDSIISTSIGNNPHVGYGYYDLGNEFFEYMSRPFKYYLDNYNLPEDVREEMEKYTYVLDDYSTARWGRIESEQRLPYLKSTGWYEQETTEDEITTYVYTKSVESENNGRPIASVYDGKVKNVSNTYKYVDGYYKRFDSQYRRIDLTVAYTETKTENGYSYNKRITFDEFDSLPSSEKVKWDGVEVETEEGTVIYFELIEPIESEDRRTDLLRGWYEYDVPNDPTPTPTPTPVPGGTDVNYVYRKDVTNEEYELLPEDTPANAWLAPDVKSGWIKTLIKYNSYNKYTDEKDEIDNINTGHYYLNNKLIVLKFKSDSSGYFKKYFFDVIGKYLMQMMPSTAITVVLFEENKLNKRHSR